MSVYNTCSMIRSKRIDSFPYFASSILLNKNTQLRESLARVRLSRESLRGKLKSSHTLHKTMEGNQRRLKVLVRV